MRRWMIWIGAVVLGGAMLSLSGCNTAEGMGKDVEGAGEGIQRAVPSDMD